MMNRDLFQQLDAHLARDAFGEAWLRELVAGMRATPATDGGWPPALVAEVAAIAAANPPVATPARRSRRSIRRSLVLNAFVGLLLLIGSAALAVTTTHSGSAPAPIRAIVDQVAEWAGLDQVSPTTTATTTTTTEPGFVPPGLSEDPPGNRGDGTGPPDNSNSGGVDVPPGLSEDPPGNRGDGTGPPDNSNAGGIDEPPGQSGEPPGQGAGSGPPDNSNSGGVDEPPGQSEDPPGNGGGGSGPPETSNAGGNGGNPNDTTKGKGTTP